MLYQLWMRSVQACLSYGFGHGKFANKMAARRPYWIVSWQQMDMHMYVIEHCPNTNFEWDLLKHVWVMALDRENSQTKWLLGGHIGSYHKTNWRAYVCHSMLPLYQVWKKSVQASPRNGCGRTDARTHGTQSISPRPGLRPAGTNDDSTLGMQCKCQWWQYTWYAV